MNDKSSNRLRLNERSEVFAAERDADRRGTHPGSSPVPVVPNIDPIQRTDQDRARSQAVIDGIMSAIAARRPQPVAEGLRPGTLVDPNGNAVLGSAGFSEEQIAEYKRDNPGSKTIE